MKQTKAFAIFIFAMFLLFGAYASWSGYVVVSDRTGLAQQVNVVGFRGGSRLIAMPGGSFVGIPPEDGVIEAKCSDGSSVTGGRFVRGNSLYADVTGEGTCEGVA